MRIALASDHAGYEMKEFLKGYVEQKGIEVVDFGTDSPESCDYPDFAHPAAESVENGRCDLGIGICGSGNGMQMSLNKHQRIRAALCWLPQLAELAREHNNANFLVLPARFIDMTEAAEIVDTFLKTDFAGGRHERRVNKIPIDSYGKLPDGVSVEGEII